MSEPLSTADVIIGLGEENDRLRAQLAQLQQEIDVLRPPAEHYNRTLARAEAAEAALVQCQQEQGADGFVMNCLIAPREGSEVLFQMGSNGRFVAVRLDGYAVVPREQWDSLEAKVAASEQDRARLRAILKTYVKHALDCDSHHCWPCNCGVAALVGEPPPPLPPLVGTGQWFAERLHPTEKGKIQVVGLLTQQKAEQQVKKWKAERPDLNPHYWERLMLPGEPPPPEPTP